jgi:hypothetical protein
MYPSVEPTAVEAEDTLPMFTRETDVFEELAQQTGEMYPSVEPTAVEAEDTLPITGFE